MKFPRSKKLVFCNNKGGVGKTTLAFNVGIELAKKGYKTALIDLDPQGNLTLQSLGLDFYQDNLFSHKEKTIYDVLKPKLSGSGDIDLSVPLVKIRDNLFILPGDIQLSLHEDLLLTGFPQAAAGTLRGYSDTSAIDRYIAEIGAQEGIDVFIIDTSPSLGVLNRVVFLGADYFVVPITADSYSVQGVRNLGEVFDGWKKHWKNTAKATIVAGQTPANHVLGGDALFIGYIMNSFNVYANRTLRRQGDWFKKIPDEVRVALSEKHCRNGLVEKSWSKPIGEIQDLGQLTAICMEQNMGVQELERGKIKELNLAGTKELQEKAIEGLDKLSNNIIDVLTKY